MTFAARYDAYDITGLFTEGNYLEYAGASLEKKVLGSEYGLDHASSREFHSFYDLLKGGKMKHTYEEIFAPVFILNAIDRSMQSGKEEKVSRIDDI